MGYPELPPEENLTPNIINFNPDDSDESPPTEQDDSPYSGYQQLTFDGETYSVDNNNNLDDEEDDEINEEIRVDAPENIVYPSDFGEIECASGSSFPDVIPVDLEVAQEVWNAPAPPDRENAIQLDETRTSMIMNAMSGISLCFPDWAQNLSEEKLKQELLDRIRGRGGDNKSSDK